MNIPLSQFSSFRRSNQRPAFALVVALVLMGFVLLLLLSLSSLVSVNTATVVTSQDKLRAEANALIGLQVALSELQESMGPDQRVSANAAILENSITVDSSNQNIVGVWDTSAWDYTNPSDEAGAVFDRWLISTRETTTDQADKRAAQKNFVSSAITGETALLVGEGSTNTAADEVRAEKIRTDDGSYAFWIGDEGQKAKINLPGDDNFENLPVVERQRQFQSPDGFEIGILDTFSTLTTDGYNEASLISFDQIPSLEKSGALDSSYRSLFHDVTLDSSGLLTNTKDGGLKNDLNLLFESDEDDYFAGEYGDLAPNDLKLQETSSNILTKRNHRALYAYTGLKDSLTVVGPNWASLREYYRLYKQLGYAADGSFSIDAQPAVPDVNRQNNSIIWDIPFEVHKSRVNDFYKGLTTDSPRQRGTRLTPSILRFEYVISLVALPYTGALKMNPGDTDSASHELAIILSPIMVLWNPYDVEIEFQGYTVQTATAIPLQFDFTIDRGDGEEIGQYHDLTRMVPTLEWANGPRYSVAQIDGYRMKPGETLVFSLSDPDLLPITNEENAFDMELGYRSTGGFYVTDVQVNGKKQNGKYIRRIPYYNADGTVKIDNEKLLLSEGQDTDLSVYVRSSFGGNGSWNSQYIVYGYLIHDGQYNNRHNIGHLETGSNGDIASLVQGQAVVTSRADIKDDIGTIGRLPAADDTQTGGFYNSSYWLDRIDIGVFDTQARPANYSSKPTKLFGNYNPSAPVNTHPWIHNRFNDETMLGPYTLIADSLQDGQFNVIDHDFNTGRGFWGESYSISEGGQNHIVAFQIPRTPIWSLGALQHANVGTYAFEPSHIIGNSFAPTLIEQDRYMDSYAHQTDGSTHVAYIPDTSYLSNIAVWDDYFFSSLAPEESLAFSKKRSFSEVLSDIPTLGLPNSRMKLAGDYNALVSDLINEDDILSDAYKKSAQYLEVDGAFNINSTSVEAWKAILSGMRDKPIQFDNATAGGGIETYNPDGTIIPRSTSPVGPEGDLFYGFRDLSDDDIRNLATAIVTEVKNRGPFMNMAHFVNRLLVPDGDERGLVGTLQAAIDTAEINDGFEGAEIDISGFPNSDAASGHSASGASGYLTQADLLQAFAPVLSARSDTFKIRAYGSINAPFGAGSKPLSEAVCEVIVQRRVDYVNPKEDEFDTNPEANLPTDLPANLSAINQRFGRQFEIVSFRWLSEKEI